jgi:anti-sigma regulatory factor (Ser/Thr protein kinase)
MSSLDPGRLVLRNDVAELQRLAGWIEGFAQHGISSDVSIARIEDNGRQFDPTRAPPPVVATSLEKAKVGDLGIHLMRSFASGMDYERREGRNRLTLRFIESTSPAPE